VDVADALGIEALLETQPDHGQARQLQHQPGALHQLCKQFGRFHKSSCQALERVSPDKLPGAHLDRDDGRTVVPPRGRPENWISLSSKSRKQLNSSVFTADAPQMMIGLPT
jgi:hypothetical protein